MKARALGRLTAMNVMLTLEYRAAVSVFILNSVARPVISLLIWLTVSDQGVRLPYGRGQLVTYYVVLGVVSMLTATWLDETLPQHIRLGGLSPWLLRPAPYVFYYISENLGQKLVNLSTLLPLVLVVAFAFRADLRLPTSPLPWLIFAASLPLAMAIRFLLELVLCSLAFWVEDVEGVLALQSVLGAFLAGQYIPLALFPPSLSGFLDAQPFRYTLSFPLEVLMGTLSAGALASGFAWASGYCLVLWCCCRLLWRSGLRAYSATGA